MNNINQAKFIPETIPGNEKLPAYITDTRSRTNLTFQTPDEPDCDDITLECFDYCIFKSYEEAKKATDGIVVLEGDFGGQIYLTCPMKYVKCSEETLRNLLREIDSFEWDCNGEEGFAITYLKSKPGDYIDGGMGGGAVEDGLWIHEDIADDKKELIRKVINGELTSII